MSRLRPIALLSVLVMICALWPLRGAQAQTTCAGVNVATGGTVSQITLGTDTYCVHSFSNAGTSTFQLNQAKTIDYLIVGGGGGAGTGGGGAGGMLTGQAAQAANSYTVQVGAGGAPTIGFNFAGSNGGNSTVFGFTAQGGGGGGRADNFNTGLNGGSGGGAARNSSDLGTANGGTGTPGQGNNGAANNFSVNAGGGGGGAGAAGSGINGGDGLASDITGVSVVYAGGGASAQGFNTGDFINGTNGAGQENPGGGGDHSQTTNLVFNPGKTGVVVLRYVVNTPPSANAGPDLTVTEGGSITLNGQSSTDPENNISSYSWARVTGSSGTLANANAAQASFTAGSGSETLVFELTVTDAFGQTSTDQVSVTVTTAITAPPPAAGGGNSVYDYTDANENTFRVHVFNQDGSFALDQTRSIDYLIVGGGGGGGAIAGGGGGGGGVLAGTASNQAVGSYPVQVGLGGAGDNRPNWPNSFTSGASGQPSAAFGVTALGGGGGGTYNTSGANVGDALNGGSGGGASHGGMPGLGTAGQGTAGNGGTGGSGNSSGGGGGGAGQAGFAGTAALAGRGGDGVPSSITGALAYYGGGGAGGGDTRNVNGGVAPNVGGLGGGGASTNDVLAGSGTAGTGGGGAGGRVLNFGDQSIGGNGGSGVVILRYLVNTPPSANAGPDADAFAGVATSLDGSGSTDAENNIATYAWAQTGGTAVTLSDASAVAPSFTPGQPNSGTSDTLTFSLTVTDAFGRVRSDSVQITLNAMPELSASKTASVFSEDGAECENLAATPPTEPATPVAVPGACIQYNITVQNTGPVAATAVELADNLPAQLAYVTSGLAGWQAGSLSVAGNTLTLTGGELGAGQTASITIRARVR